MSKKIFITGSAGFIGFHLARTLASRGDEVVGFDNFNSYYTPRLKRERAKILLDQGIRITEGDICDKAGLERAIKEHKTTHIVHLAAQAGVRYSLVNPEIYVQTNIHGFTHVLEIARTIPEVKLIYASSSSVYGTNTKVPFSETDPVDSQASLYGVTKRSNELMAKTYNHLYGLSVTGLRFFTVYGPWGRPDMAYFSFAEKIFEGTPIEVYNHGEMLRDFTHVDDIVKGTIASIDLGAHCEVFNLGNHKPETLNDFIAILEQAIGKKANKVMKPMQSGDVVTTYADISHSQKHLGFTPTISLKKGLPEFVAWLNQWRISIPK